MPKRNAPRHSAAIRTGLTLLGTGKAQTKGDACRLVDVSPPSLQPHAIARQIALSPELRAATRPTTRMLDMTVDVDGETWSAGKALAACAETSVRTLVRVGRRSDQPLTRDEEKALARATKLLAFARECGLWDESPHDSLPGELQRLAEAESLAMSPDHWARDWSRTDGVGPTMRKLRALEVAQPSDSVASPSESEQETTS